MKSVSESGLQKQKDILKDGVQTEDYKSLYLDDHCGHTFICVFAKSDQKTY